VEGKTKGDVYRSVIAPY